MAGQSAEEIRRAARTAGGCKPRPEDPRFTAPSWQRWPFSVFSQAFMLTERWWQEAITGVPGISRHHERIVSFAPGSCYDRQPDGRGHDG